MKKALITGITGQDGSYLAELLLGKGYEVHGLVRRSSSFNTHRIDHLYQGPDEPHRRLVLHYADLSDVARLTTLIEEIQPNEVYNLAAQSHVGVSFQEPVYTGMIDGVAVIALLEAIRISKVPCRFYQASTSEMFGDSPPPQNEQTAFRPRSPYAIAKLQAYWTVRNYREAYDIHASNGILFNHESPRRGETFVTRKITLAAARIANGSREVLTLGNLNAARDWGYAPEYVEGMWQMVNQAHPGDFVLATGTAATVRDFVEIAFSEVGLNYEDHLKTDPRYLRPTEVDSLWGDASLAREKLGWTAQTHFRELAKIMIAADLDMLK